MLIYVQMMGHAKLCRRGKRQAIHKRTLRKSRNKLCPVDLQQFKFPTLTTRYKQEAQPHTLYSVQRGRATLKFIFFK